MAEKIFIRLVESLEIHLLRELGEATFRETFKDQNTTENLEAYLAKSFALTTIQAQYDNTNTDFYFARVNDEVLGYLKLNYTTGKVEIERIYVKQAAQGQKIGKALFEFSLGIARSRSAEWLWLGVWQENKNAVDFYAAKGLEVFDTRKFKLGNELQDDFLMRLRIS